jgi:hypothetical protein
VPRERQRQARCGYKTQFDGKCFNCGKTGHRAEDCWDKDENKDKRAKTWKPASERGAEAAAGGGDSRVEVLLCALTFPTTQALLDDPNVWIGDTAATVHMTPYGNGMTNMRKAKQDESVMMRNKQVEKTTKFGDITGNLCDKHGFELMPATLKDVNLVPGSGNNLFSLTKLVKSGWKLAGDDNMLTLKKDDAEVTSSHLQTTRSS